MTSYTPGDQSAELQFLLALDTGASDDAIAQSTAQFFADQYVPMTYFSHFIQSDGAGNWVTIASDVDTLKASLLQTITIPQFYCKDKSVPLERIAFGPVAAIRAEAIARQAEI